MKKIILVIFVVVVAVLGYASVKNGVNLPSPSSSGKLEVTTSFYPLYFFAKEIGGEFVHVTNITPSGAEPHDYEPSTSDIAQIEKSKLLILNGRGFESWGGKIKDILKDKGETGILEVTEGLAILQSEDMKPLVTDPHIWLDPVIAKDEANRIASVFYQVDPPRAVQYQVNLQKLQMELDQLDTEFKTSLSNCKQKSIVTSHSAFGYLAKQYGLKQISISGLSPDAEPSPKDLARVSDFVKKNNIKYIFFETLVSPRLADTIAKETGAKSLIFNPLEGLTPEEQRQGKDYFSVMRENLQNLKIALECN